MIKHLKHICSTIVIVLTIFVSSCSKFEYLQSGELTQTYCSQCSEMEASMSEDLQLKIKTEHDSPYTWITATLLKPCSSTVSDTAYIYNDTVFLNFIISTGNKELCKCKAKFQYELHQFGSAHPVIKAKISNSALDTILLYNTAN